MVYMAGFLVLAGIIVAMIMKSASASKDARMMANSGSIRLIDINGRIFAAEQLAKIRRQAGQVEMALSRSSVAA